MFQPVLGRFYGPHVLHALRERHELTFGVLVRELGTSRSTLSKTLSDMVSAGLVNKRRYGRSTYYSITGKGSSLLENLEMGELTVDRMAQLAYKNLVDRGLIEIYSDVPRDQIIQEIRKKVVAMLEEFEEDVKSREEPTAGEQDV